METDIKTEMKIDMENDMVTDVKKLVIATCNALDAILSALEHVMPRMERLMSREELQKLRCFQAATDPDAAAEDDKHCIFTGA